MVGREKQTKFMQKLITKPKSSFVAVTGRRRVGKTYLIDEVYKDYFCLRVTGIQDVDISTQIRNFTEKLIEYSKQNIETQAQNWQELFILLKQYLQKLSKKRKQIIFIDELPWIATKRSGFIQLLAHLWNDYLSKEKHFILVVCGSASSWIAKKIVNDKGGLHNRLTEQIQLKPFTLAETKNFLRGRGIKLSNQAISELYMIMGGIPFYLEQIKKGLSVQQIILKLCFSDNGLLKNEYQNLYRALFKHPRNHEAIVTVLANAPRGMVRSEIIEKANVKAGGPYTRAMEDLLLSGFVEEIRPYGRKKRGTVYRLSDEYSIFYHRFIKPNKTKEPEVWNHLYKSQAYKIWTGFAFENLCQRHIFEIKKALGISGMYSDQAGFQQQDNEEQQGFQIDLIIDRNDNIINLCECKYYNDTFIMTKQYAEILRKRRNAFMKNINTKKTVFNTLITSYGALKNEHYLDVIDNELTISDLMIE